MDIGTIQTMRIAEVNEDHYLLTKGMTTKTLDKENLEKTVEVGDFVEVFVLKEGITTKIPKLEVGLYEWVTVAKVEGDTLYVDIGNDILVVIANDDLPAFKSVWPKEGARLYVTLKSNRAGDLFVVPAKERQFSHLINDASEVDLNERVSGHVIRTAREGTVILSEEGYRGFIHHSERDKEPTLGELVTGRVIEVKEDGTLNVSIKPLGHERIKDDATVILDYLQDNNGEMDFGDRSKPDDIRATFQMSKSAFKRALGRLMREGKIEQRDGKTFLKNK